MLVCMTPLLQKQSGFDSPLPQPKSLFSNMANFIQRTKAFDWAKVKAILAPQDFTIVNEQRARHQELSRILATPLPKIDFQQYSQVLSNQDVVKQAEQAVKQFQPTKGEVGTIIQSLDEQKLTAVCF